MMDDTLLNQLEVESALYGVRVALIRAYQMGQLQAYTECLQDVGAITREEAGSSTVAFLTTAPERVAELTRGERDDA